MCQILRFRRLPLPNLPSYTVTLENENPPKALRATPLSFCKLVMVSDSPILKVLGSNLANAILKMRRGSWAHTRLEPGNVSALKETKPRRPEIALMF